MDTKLFRRILYRVKSEEGFRGNPYTCPTGHLTVGFGTKLPLTEHQAELLASDDLQGFIGRLDDRLGNIGIYFGGLPDDAQCALADMAYQNGIDGLLRFKKMLAGVKVKNWRQAHDECLNSLYAKQTPGRAKRNAQLLLQAGNTGFDVTRE